MRESRSTKSGVIQLHRTERRWQTYSVGAHSTRTVKGRPTGPVSRMHPWLEPSAGWTLVDHQRSTERVLTHTLIQHVLAPLVRLVWRPEVLGANHIPRTGPVILAANHRAAVDTALLGLLAGRPVSFLGKAEYFTGRGLKGRAVAGLLRGLGYVPVRRGNAAAGLSALQAGRGVLAAGGVFGIYPEGTRSRDGRLHRGHTGVAALALTTGAVVVPVGLRGTERVQPVGKRLPRLAQVSVRFGQPLDFSRYEGMAGSPVIRRAVTDEIMYAIAELSGQEYVDTYHKRPDELG